MLEYMQNRCDDTGNLTKKDTKKKIAGKGCANNHIFLPKTKEKKGGEKAVREALVCKHQFICYLRMLIKEKWCKAFSWMNAY